MKVVNRFTAKVIFECQAETMRETVLQALKQGADLSGANLFRANLSGANLPVLAEIYKMEIRVAICSQVCSEPDKLEMRSWHTCDTVHCIAGWTTAIHPQGKLLESIFGTSVAAALIMHVCEGEIPDFHTDNETAMRWIKGEKLGRRNVLPPRHNRTANQG